MLEFRKTSRAIAASLALCAFVASIVAGPAPARSGTDWEVVGVPGFSPGEVLCCQIAVDAQGVPHVAYQDLSLGNNPASVQRFDGGAWSFLGLQGKASLMQAWYNRLAFDPSGSLLVATRDYGVSGRMNLRRFDGGAQAWVNVGTFGPSAGESHYTDVAIDHQGVPYVVYADRTTVPGDRATVMRFANGAWSTLGAPGLSAAAADYPSIGLDASEVPCVAYSDASLGGKATVMRWDGGSGTWQPIGSPGFSAAQAMNVRLAFDRVGAPCVAFQQYHLQIVVMRWNGAQWLQLGGSASGADRPTVETEGWRQWLSLAFDSQNAPYVAYQRLDDLDRAAVRRFDGAQWNPVGSLGFTPPDADYMAMTLGPDDVPYVVFRDSTAAKHATVMRYAPSPYVYCGPGPSSLGCVATIGASGTPSFSGASKFRVTASPVMSGKVGMLLYSMRPSSTPFQGSTLCLASPIRRCPVQNSGGTFEADCSGVLDQDMTTIFQSGGDPELVPGAKVFAQFWFRDPGNASGAALSGAVRFEIEL